METDWKLEVENLKTSEDFETTPFFKPKEGIHKVLILGDRGIREVNMPDGTVKKKLFLDIEYNKDKYTWSINKALTKRSLFGQIAILGAHWEGNLSGKLITLVVKGDGKLRSYSIREAEDLEADTKAENGAN